MDHAMTEYPKMGLREKVGMISLIIPNPGPILM
jgi:hypothetical protein